MESVSFTIPGRVTGKGRPKFARRGNFVQAYTPAATVSMEGVVRQFAAAAMKRRTLFDGPLVLDITVSLHTPQSWSKKKRAAAFYVTGKPDADNVAKLLADALSGIVWHDDRQISDLHVRRRYNDLAPESVEVQVFTPGTEEWIPRKIDQRVGA